MNTNTHGMLQVELETLHEVRNDKMTYSYPLHLLQCTHFNIWPLLRFSMKCAQGLGGFPYLFQISSWNLRLIYKFTTFAVAVHSTG